MSIKSIALGVLVIGFPLCGQVAEAQVEIRPIKPEIGTTTSLAWSGWTRAGYGSPDATPAVDGVEQALRALDGERRDSHTFRFDPTVAGTDGVRINSHAQGVTRLPGVGNNNWLVVSKADSDRGQAGLIFVDYQFVSDGRSWKYADRRDGDSGQARYFHGQTESDHPGGIQVCGKTLAVPYGNGTRAWVAFYDVSDPHNVREVSRLTLPGQPTFHQVAFTRLSSGHYLVFAGAQNDASGWFYQSTGTSPTHMGEWKQVSFWQQSQLAPSPGKWRNYQSMNFLVDKKDGTIFLVGMGGDNRSNYLDVFRVERNGFSAPRMTWTMDKGIRTRAGGATLRAGGGLHVTPGGREVVLYAIEKAQGFGSRLMVEEFRDQ